jgi:hypothetical protein
MNIDIFTFTSNKSIKIAEFLYQTGEKLKSGQHKLNWKCVMTHHENEVLEPPPIGFECVAQIKHVRKKLGSPIHAVALHEAAKHITSDYVIYVDADVALLRRGWDDIVINELDSYDCFGFDYGISVSRYAKFPGVFFFCFRSYILEKLVLDWSPGKFTNMTSKDIARYKGAGKNTVTNENVKYHKMPIGTVSPRETGWRIAKQLKSAGYQGHHISRNTEIEVEVLPNFMPPTSCKYRGVWCYNEKPYGCHMGGCSRKSPHTKIFISDVMDYIDRINDV